MHDLAMLENAGITGQDDALFPFSDSHDIGVIKIVFVTGIKTEQAQSAGQFAEVHMRLEPLPRDTGYEFDWEVFGGAISRSFESSIQKGVKQVMEQGVIAGYPVVDVKAVVYDGKEHPVDSKDIAFQIAGKAAFKESCKAAKPILLEPVMNLEIKVPEDCVGGIMADISGRRGRVMGIDSGTRFEVVKAQVPQAETFKYASELRSMTSGRGTFEMEFSHYEQVPANIAQKVIAEAEAAKKAEQEG